MRKRVALKLLPPAATGGNFVDRFRIEARVMADLNHPNIVQVHHAGEENGRYYLTMDYVCSPSGTPQTLEAMMEERGRLPEDEVERFLLQICDALAQAHGLGLVHRDLKPANILVDGRGRLKVTDFGLAKVVGDDYLRSMIDRSMSLSMAEALSLGDEATLGGAGDGAKRSSARAILGTYEYMAPEQKAGGEITAQTDLYAVGIILYRMLTGEKPEGMFDLPSECGCSEMWDGIIRTCLQKKPERRPTDVGALMAMIEPAGTGELNRSVRSGKPKGRMSGQTGEGSACVFPAIKKELSHDLLEVPNAQYAPLDGLAPGSSDAQDRQSMAVKETGLPLEVKSKASEIFVRLVPAGSFTMGSPSNEKNRSSDEKQHPVTISKPFYCGKYPVTQAQWERVMGTNPSKFKNAGGDAPVENVSWEDTQNFLKKLSKIEGVPEGTYRLLTEAQWEYACRAGTSTPFCFGDQLNSMMANFDGNYPDGRASKGPYRQTTTPVGQFKPNAFGLYDMHGNVWEWVCDWYGSYPSGSVTDPTGPLSGSSRVFRGGSWYSFARRCRSANRDKGILSGRDDHLGFRLQRTAPSLNE